MCVFWTTLKRLIPVHIINKRRARIQFPTDIAHCTVYCDNNNVMHVLNVLHASFSLSIRILKNLSLLSLRLSAGVDGKSAQKLYTVDEIKKKTTLTDPWGLHNVNGHRRIGRLQLRYGDRTEAKHQAGVQGARVRDECGDDLSECLAAILFFVARRSGGNSSSCSSGPIAILQLGHGCRRHCGGIVHGDGSIWNVAGQ